MGKGGGGRRRDRGVWKEEEGGVEGERGGRGGNL